MSRTTLALSPELQDYIRNVSVREPTLLTELRQETAQHPRAGMQIGPEQGQFMALLVTLMGARRIVEVGVFTGYSSLAMALALPPDGEVIALDHDPETTGVAQRYWQRAGLTERIQLHLGPALESLDRLLAKGERETFDFAFIDADKANYDSYYEHCLRLVRPGGLVALDNVLWGGNVADPAVQDNDTEALRALNAKLHEDERVDISLIPISDGLTLARKRR